MITLTLDIGATDISPLAFAQFAATAVATGEYETKPSTLVDKLDIVDHPQQRLGVYPYLGFSYEGYRLGKLAVKMTETMHSASAYKSNIVGITEVIFHLLK